jgi:hypothetical protein
LKPHAVSFHLVIYKTDSDGTHFILRQEGMELRKSGTK